MQLNDAEQIVIQYLAKKRIEYNRNVGAIATVYGGRNPLKAEIDYYGAEFVFCKQFNIYPDISISKFGEYDCIYEGFTIDIKHTERENGRLLVKAKRWDNPPKYFALMIGTFPNYRFAGFYLSSELLQEKNLDHTLPYPAYAISQDKLYKELI